VLHQAQIASLTLGLLLLLRLLPSLRVDVPCQVLQLLPLMSAQLPEMQPSLQKLLPSLLLAHHPAAVAVLPRCLYVLLMQILLLVER
jgi:hypothetical protein